jgi:hypothetical protein
VCHVSLPSSYQSRLGHIHLLRVLPLVGRRSKTPIEPEAHEPTAHAPLSPQLFLSSVSKLVVAVCVLHESEDQTWQVKVVSRSAQSADSGLSVVTTVVATAHHLGAAPPASVHSLQS